VEENKNIFTILTGSNCFEIKCKTSVCITAAVCIFEEWDDHSGYIPLCSCVNVVAHTRLHKRRIVLNKEVVLGFEIFTALLMKITIV
jgi:hypothetical protein